MSLHDAQELDDDLGRRSDENLSLSLSLGIDNAVQGVVQDADSNHVAGLVLEVIELDGYRESRVSSSVPASMGGTRPSLVGASCCQRWSCLHNEVAGDAASLPHQSDTRCPHTHTSTTTTPSLLQLVPGAPPLADHLPLEFPVVIKDTE